MQIADFNFTFHGKGDEKAIFMASDIDEASSTKYYGFLTNDGRWMIMQTTATTVRYCLGQSGYKTATTGAWASRAGLTYSYFNEVRNY
jgi:hypothetical protein